MKVAAIVALFAAAVNARIVYAPIGQSEQARMLGIYRREVPQEHSHDIQVNAIRPIINKSNPNKLPDPIFALLGNAAASTGISQAGTAAGFTDPDCLQQNIADQCITNCGTDATCKKTCIQFRALERNTGSVGLKSALCNTAAKSAELSTILQHFDPAGDGATAHNKDVEINVAKVLVSLGLSPDDAATAALETTTFGPGQLGDPTARGLSCDGAPGQADGTDVIAPSDGTDPVTGLSFKAGDKIDCITLATVQNAKSKRVPAASRADILAAVGGAAGNVDDNNNNNNNTGNIDFAQVKSLLEQILAILNTL